MSWDMAASFSEKTGRCRLIFFYNIINGLAQVPFEGVLVEVYMGIEVNTIHNLDGFVFQLASMHKSVSLKND